MIRNGVALHIRRLLLAVAIAFQIAQTGCALFGEGGLQHAGGYKVVAPRSWKAQDKGDSDEAYRLPSGSVATLITSCNSESPTTLENLTKHLLFGARNIEVKDREELNIGGQNGLYSSIHATLDKVPFQLEVFVLNQASCVYDFVLMNRKAIPAEDRKQFLEFIKSFKNG